MQPTFLPLADKPKSSDGSSDSSKERQKNASGLQLSLPRRAQLTVALTGPTLAFVEPPSERGGGGKDAQIYGHVTLQLPKTKRIKSLVVELVGHCNLGFSPERGGYETGEVLRQTVDLLKGESNTLTAGEHLFEFCLFVPSTAAPYEAGHAGRVYHRVVARAEGAGLMGADLRADTPVGVIAAPPENEASLLLNVEQESERLGPYSFGLSSSCLCVGGLVCVSFNMPAPPHSVIIDKIDLSVVQEFTISSLSRRSKHASPFGPTFETEVFKPDRIRVMRLDGTNIGAGLNTTHAQGRVFTKEEERDDEGIARGELVPPPLSQRRQEQEAAAKGKGRATPAPQAPTPRPLAKLTAGEAFEVWHLIRLPRCTHLRPSTQQGSISPINKTHQFEASIHYRLANGTGAPQILTIRKPVDFASCNCLLSNLRLPRYAKTGPAPGYLPDPSNAHELCACHLSTDILLHHERSSGAAAFSNPPYAFKAPPPSKLPDSEASLVPSASTLDS